MQISNEFIVPLPPDEAWPVLLDLERVAPCLPGATITAIDGDDFEGKAKIKVGPITAEYKGAARFVERDEAGLRATLRATGKDARGQGNVSANIGLRLVAHEGGSRVLVDTEMDISGKIAQFGRGVINDAAAALLGVFAERLNELMVGGEATAEATATTGGAATNGAAPRTVGRSTPANQDEALDLVKLARESRGGSTPAAGFVQPAWIPAIISGVAAIISVFAAGYAAGKNKSK
ncbi:SRPBCC family protein [Rhodococcus sp. NPDC057014]|uniref:SRPBCC family protein n=1 Tax=Rhodococcus sp. NPDC057014 TaxID=3346000 RepID=UPI00362A5585